MNRFQYNLCNLFVDQVPLGYKKEWADVTHLYTKSFLGRNVGMRAI